MPRASEPRRKTRKTDVLAGFHEATRTWLAETFEEPTEAQDRAWPAIHRGESTLLLAPTGSGKTLAAFLVAIDRALFRTDAKDGARGRKVLYVSPLKALAVDIERNLRAPLAGIERCAKRLATTTRTLDVAIRTGDTDAKERARQAKHAPDILITTPESLFLILTSNAREALIDVDTVIVDEIHAVLPSKRGTHLFLSLERLEALRSERRPDAPALQRIGLSATQRPLEEVARLLGGGTLDPQGRFVSRPVTVLDARAPKAIEIRVEVPVEDMSQLGDRSEGPEATNVTRSIWPSIHPRLVELVRAHRSTMIFVNSRRLAERLAADLNETAGEELALAHHGSLAREQRVVIEDRLKKGTLPAIVATSSLELGLDLGAVDLVIQIEAPPSVSSGLQRIGRASHHVGGTSRGILFPKHRADLLASAALVPRMHGGEVEKTAYPRNPVDVLAQQLVAMIAVDELTVDEAYRRVRGAAPFAELSRTIFEDVLDMLSGRYPSDAFAELRPRITWDRHSGTLRSREGAKRLAIMNAGVIPDRGLYGVFLAESAAGSKPNTKTKGPSRRLGELDEEMVFESREGEVFLLGASSWRIVEITRDQVLVAPAPGEPGKMPFWHGDRVGRSAEAGEVVGRLVRDIARRKDDANVEVLVRDHALDERAANNLVRYVRDQHEAIEALPTDKTIVIERFQDELGDYRLCILSPWGARVHAPLATAISTRARDELGVETEALWTDDGIVLRFPETDTPPDVLTLLPTADEVEGLLVAGVSATALFAARFRECAGRALLLPRKTVAKRQPLWAQRKRAADLLSVASRFPSFPIVLETYREVLEDVFDLASLRELLAKIEKRTIEIVLVDSDRPSPFAASVLFSYVANFMYDADAPLAERRAQALSIDYARLRELLGEVDLSEILGLDAILAVEERLQGFGARLEHADAVHDLLLLLGDLSIDELSARARREDETIDTARARLTPFVDALRAARRVIVLRLAGQERLVAIEDASRFRDAVGCSLPVGLPATFLESAAEPLLDLVGRYARTHGPFYASQIGARLGLAMEDVIAALDQLEQRGRVVRGNFLPEDRRLVGDAGAHGERCDADVLKQIKRRSLAALRKEIEPVSHEALARFLPRWHGIGDESRKLRGHAALSGAIERLEGVPIPLEALLRDVLPARVDGFRPSDLDVLVASGEVVWRGIDAAGGGKIALYFTDRYALLSPVEGVAEGDLETRLLSLFRDKGALFFHDMSRALGGTFTPDLVEALWSLVWKGLVTNDTLVPLRARLAPETPSKRRSRLAVSRSRATPGTEGRWSILPPIEASATDRRAALVRTVLERHGILTRESTAVEIDDASFGRCYEVLRGLEDAGRIRRGWFVEGLGATQFAARGADEMLRGTREPSSDPSTLVLAATDPAQPYGASLPWPAREGAKAQRANGAQVILLEGALIGWIGRTEQSLLTFLPTSEPARARTVDALADALAGLVRSGARRVLMLASIDGESAMRSPLTEALIARGFRHGLRGLLLRAGDAVRGPRGPSTVLRSQASRPVVAETDDWDDDPFEDDTVGETSPDP
ncbi:MAG: DEAD/DEAH box helicase [Deltaproteobacteria bacterium]|nr:DEAD/DEAH box helicase [Deltaproteobacteria bacterium]